MANYASGIEASALSLVDAPAPSSDASVSAGTTSRKSSQAPAAFRSVPSAANAPFSGLSLAGVPESSREAPSVANDRPSEPSRAKTPVPEGRAPGVTNSPSAEVEVIEIKSPDWAMPLPANTTGGPGRKHEERPIRHAHASHGTSVPGRDETAPKRAAEQHRHGKARTKRWKVTLIAGALGSLALGSLIVVAVLVAMRSESVPAQQFDVAKAAPRAVVPNAAAASDRAAPAAADAQSPPQGEAQSSLHEDAQSPLHGDALARKLQVLKSAGNWNVFVVYAGEWARAQPANPDAWRELSTGYVRLRQFRDALDAATKAVQVAPDSFLAWQNLGKVNLALQDPAAALAAFERATALNDQDIVSLMQAGALEAQLGRLPEARIAFDKALALSPEDIGALCGAASVAQRQGRAKDAEAIAQQLKALDGSCRDSTTVENVRVVALSGPARSKTGSPASR